MNRIVAAALSGALFGAGLLVSGMVRPAKVIGFLDVTGAWDPSLMAVLVSAVGVYALAYWMIARRRSAPWLAPEFHVPPRARIDARLLGGAALFGIGWGLVGLCPGPAVVSVGGGNLRAALFVAAMLVGMLLVPRADRNDREARLRASRSAPPR